MSFSQLTLAQQISMWLLPILFAVTVHEVAHGYVAYLLGDKTAKILGRLTLNPVKHIDIVGTIIVPLILLLLGGIVLGWAKPVPINARHLHKPKRDMALIAIAGPMANFLMALIWAAIAKLGMYFGAHALPGALAIYSMGMAGISINLMLMLLNLFPLPPLDGGHIIAGVLPQSWAIRYERIAPYGFLILLLLLAIGVISLLITPALHWLLTAVARVFGLAL